VAGQVRDIELHFESKTGKVVDNRLRPGLVIVWGEGIGPHPDREAAQNMVEEVALYWD